MAEQVGIIKLNGPMKDISFYKSRGRYFARSIGKVSSDRRKYSPEFAINRDNESEFGSAGSLSARIRGAVMDKNSIIPFNDLHNRLSKVLIAIVKSDQISDRGKRNFFKGNVSQLEGFNFNKFLPMEHNYFGKIEHTFDTTTLKAELAMQFNPVSDLKSPSGANQVRISLMLVIVPEYSNEVFVKLSSVPQYVLLNDQHVSLSFEITHPASSTEALKLHLLKIEFLQEVNGQIYNVMEKGGIVLTILDVLLYKR